MSTHVVIVGGGLSGLAAGVEFASRGIGVTLLEQKPALGGRAYSFTDGITGDTIDNGQHVLIAGYDRTMHFLETIGTLNLLRVQPVPLLLFHHPLRGFHEFRLPLLPSPFNLLVGVLRCQLFSFMDRLRLLRAGHYLMRGLDEVHLAGHTIEQWLSGVGQNDECIRSLWEPLAVSMLNEKIEKASALVFVKALRKAFLGGSKNAALAIPTVGLTQLYVDGAKEYIMSRGGQIKCNADVEEVLVERDLAIGVKLRNGQHVDAEAVVLAIPPYALLPILPPQVSKRLSDLATMEVAPIVSIHLWFNEKFMEHEFVGLIGKRIQWLFNKRKVNGERGRGAHVSAVISGAHDFVEMTKDELVNIALQDIRSLYPDCREEPRHAVVIREKRATYSSSPRVELLRPPNRTEFPNLCLAGDWTSTGYPATIEGAILSAEEATRIILEYMRQD